MTHNAVLLDTSFFLRFLNESDPMFEQADGYFRYFIQQEMDMLISTISVAEYCVGGSMDELPLRNLQILPFNLDHARRAGDFARVAFRAKKDRTLEVSQRSLIPNDTKLFAQADCERAIHYYLSSDRESKRIFDLIRDQDAPRFQFLDLHIPHHQAFGILDL
jgi:predicted nucleic acid-binding protein